MINMNRRRTNATAAECAFRQRGEDGDETTTRREEKREREVRVSRTVTEIWPHDTIIIRMNEREEICKMLKGIQQDLKRPTVVKMDTTAWRPSIAPTARDSPCKAHTLTKGKKILHSPTWSD